MGIVKIILAIGLGLLILRIGLIFLRSFARPVPEPPPPGELRRVRITYRCPICGTEVRMTRANDEMPEPPRHCLEDMELVAPVDE
jgi:threonine dehydrogenase-like Zn-dependent dehydrogenase